MFEIAEKQCDTCLFRKQLFSDEIRDDYITRVLESNCFLACHCYRRNKKNKVCCRVFWEKHKNDTSITLLASKLGVFRFVPPDNKKQK